ncbi:MAG: hypothetical protein Q4C10_06880 [Clostridia bacterium]|nr:hypothetical protein [Clostridia bacterium]
MERNRNGRLPWAIALLIVTFTIVIALAGGRIISNATHRSSYDYKAVQLASNRKLQVVDDGFVYYDGSYIGAVTTDGRVKWSYLIGTNADFAANANGVAAWAGDTLTLIDSQTGTPSFSGAMETDVLSATIGSRYTAVLLGPEYNSTIVLMEQGGRRINSITLNSQTVIEYGFFSNGSLLWLMSLDTSGTVPSCTVNTYKPGKEMVGSIHDNEQLMYGVVFQSSYFCCAGDTYLKVYDYTGKEDKSRRRKVYGWYMAALDESVLDNPLMAFVPNAQYDSESGMQDVRMIRSDLDQQVRMPYGCQSLIARNDRVYGFSTEGYVAIATQGSPNVYAYALPMLFDKVYGVTANNMAILGNGNIIYILNLS